jgi:hypothetical protein
MIESHDNVDKVEEFVGSVFPSDSYDLGDLFGPDVLGMHGDSEAVVIAGGDDVIT